MSRFRMMLPTMIQMPAGKSTLTSWTIITMNYIRSSAISRLNCLKSSQPLPTMLIVSKVWQTKCSLLQETQRPNQRCSRISSITILCPPESRHYSPVNMSNLENLLLHKINSLDRLKRQHLRKQKTSSRTQLPLIRKQDTLARGHTGELNLRSGLNLQPAKPMIHELPHTSGQRRTNLKAWIACWRGRYDPE